MSTRDIYLDGELRERWDDQARTYTALDATGAVTGTRSYTSQESAEVEARASIAASAANRASIETQALAALAANRTFLGLSSPTNAQTLAQVRALTRQNIAIIRLVLGQLDATD